MSEIDDTPQSASEQPMLLDALRIHLGRAWVTQFRFRTFGVAEFVTCPAQLFAVLTSREVTSTILAATALCGIAPVIWSLLLFPDQLLFWVGFSMTPFMVTYLGVSLTYAWVVASKLCGQTSPNRLLYPITILLASGAISFIGFHFMEFMPMALTELYVLEARHVSFIVAVSFPLIYFIASILVHSFVLNHVVPVGSNRWNKLGERAVAIQPNAQEENQTIRRLRAGAKGLITIGDTDIPANSIRLVQAQGNYVKLMTSDKELTIRQPFSKVLKLLPNSRGVQLHRSRWAAFEAITDVANNDDGLYVTVEGASRIRVAKSRAELVSKALASAGLQK